MSLCIGLPSYGHNAKIDTACTHTVYTARLIQAVHTLTVRLIQAVNAVYTVRLIQAVNAVYTVRLIQAVHTMYTPSG